MGKNVQKSVEDKRKKLIDRLIAFKRYKKDDKHLFELSLSELENEYKTFQSFCHPHSDLGSIQWTCRRS